MSAKAVPLSPGGSSPGGSSPGGSSPGRSSPGGSPLRFPLPRTATVDDPMANEILAGLGQTPKRLPCKYFYDAFGSQLFERISTLDEYYPTRTELRILHEHGPAIAAHVGPHAWIIELGSGSDLKIRALLASLAEPAAYVPMDISRDQLFSTAARIAADFPPLEVVPLHADYTSAFRVPRPSVPFARAVAFFPGSTFGNFDLPEALEFLRRVRALVGEGGGLLLGLDLRKDPSILHAAYNDEKGVTAAFNLNLLARLNREVDAGFDLRTFRHYAYYEPAHGRIVMTLVSSIAQVVPVAGQPVSFAEGEPIITEYSYKFSLEEVSRLACATGFVARACFTDDARLFSQHYLEAVAP